MRQLQIHCQNSQSMVSYQNFSELTVVNVPVAEFRESIALVIPEIIIFLSVTELNVRKVAANTLSKLAGQGNMLSFLT